MRLREATIIFAQASAVWPFLADPVLQASWNPKIASIDRDRSGPVQVGERFEMLYRISGRESLSRVEVTVSQPFERVVFRHRTTRKSIEHVTEEEYTVTPHRKGLRVVQTIDLSGAGLSWAFLIAIWFLKLFGRSAEEPYLKRLKRLVELSKVPA